MIKLTSIYKSSLPLGYFKRVVRQFPVFSTQMGVDKANNNNFNTDIQNKGNDSKSIGRRVGKGENKGILLKQRNNCSSSGVNKLNTNINTNTNRFTIFRVNSKLVDSKNLNKFLKKVVKRDFSKNEIEHLLKYIVINMPQTLDDLNIFTIIIMLSKLEIRDDMLFKLIIPYFYKMKDFDKIIDCLLYGSMLFGENDSLKMFATKLIYELPSHINSMNYNNISKLCESLCNLKLYSEEFGRVISSLVGKDTLIGNEIPIVNFSSILNYLSRVGVSDESSWKSYTRFSLENLSISNYKIIMRLLQSYANQNISNKELLKNAGDILIKHIEIMHPKDVSNLSYLYFKMNYKHESLLEEIFKVGERIATGLDGSSSLKMLSGFYLYFSSMFDYGKHGLLMESQTQSPSLLSSSLDWDNYLHCFRTVYLLYNNISNHLNSLNFEEFLLLFKTLEVFSFINTTNLQMNLKVFLTDCNKSHQLSTSNVDRIKMRFSERKLVNPGEQRFIRLLIS